MKELGNFEPKPDSQETEKSKVEKVLLNQAKTIIGNVEVDPELLADKMIDLREKGQLVGMSYKKDVEQIDRADFVAIAKRAIEEQKNNPPKEEINDGPVLTARDIPKSPMNDPE